MSVVEGTTTEKFAPLRDRLTANLESGRDVGASVAVFHHGELVVDLWGGFVDGARSAPWVRDTIVNVWSTTKTMTFLVMLMLADQGQLDFNQKVAFYWPEFAAAGKGDIEVRHVMNHTSGLSGFSSALGARDLGDWDRCVADLAGEAPWWSDRTRSGYHALTQGYLIGELVRRVTGESIGTFFRREVAESLGADFHIGLPESEDPRVSVVIPPPIDESMLGDHDSIHFRTLTSPLIEPGIPRERWWRAAEIPAANGHGNARSVALIQEVIAHNGEAGGKRFFSSSTANRIFDVQVSNRDQVLDINVNFGLGYGLASADVPLGPRACFWGGFGGSVIIIDQSFELTVAYMMNKMEVGLVGDTRGMEFALLAAIAAES